MNDFSVSMALVDYIPVIFFAIASVILLRDLYNKMSKGAFALFSAGVIDVTVAGALKATWKLSRLLSTALTKTTMQTSWFWMQNSFCLGNGLMKAATMSWIPSLATSSQMMQTQEAPTWHTTFPSPLPKSTNLT